MANLTGQFYANQAYHGYGTQLLIDKAGGSPNSYEAIPFIRRITPGEMLTNMLPATHLRSPAAHMEKKAGLRDSGPMACEMQHVPKHESQKRAGGGTGSFQTGGLVFMWINRVEKDFLLVLSDGSPSTEIPFTGVISRYQIGEIGEDAIVPLNMEATPIRDFSSSLP
jgi:hypothetical protein